MSTAWVAGTVRATALARRRLGVAGARQLAASPSLHQALVTLASTPYGHDVRADRTLAGAQHDVGAVLLWHLRVLAGWLPREGADRVRLLAGGFEVANVDEHVRRLRGEPVEPAYTLGALDTSWSRVAGTTSPTEVREVMAASPWGDPGDASPWALHLGMRLAWADRVAAGVPEAETWARAAAALLVAREAVSATRRLTEALSLRASGVVGPAFVAASSGVSVTLAGLAALLPSGTRGVLEGVASPEDLWRGEVAWWRRVERDGFRLLRTSGFGPARVVGAVAVLAADAWRVRAALEVAARAGTSGRTFVPTGTAGEDRMAAREAFDALA